MNSSFNEIHQNNGCKVERIEVVVDNENNDEVKEEENVESFTEKEDVQEAINLSGITNFSFLALEVELKQC